MQNSNRKVFDKLVTNTKVYLIIIFIILVILCIQNSKMIIPSILVYAGIAGYTLMVNSKGKSQITETIQDLTLTMDSAAKSSLISSPFPLIILETQGHVVWKSSKFSSEFANVEISKHIDEIMLIIKQKQENNEKELTINYKIEEKYYRVVGKYVSQKNRDKRKKTEYLFILYFIDETENARLQVQYEDSKSCITIINIDNYEETMQQLVAEDRLQIVAEIDRLIYEWTGETQGVLIKSDRDKYIYLFEKRYMEKIKEDKFSVLDKIKEIPSKGSVQITLSIAVSDEGNSDKEKYQAAQASMEMILGRGGDQAVIKESDGYKFYGGKAQEVEKRNKVKARVVAKTLEKMIKESKKVLIMGHKTPDMDAIGAALGINRLCHEIGKKSYIIEAENNESIKEFMKSLEENEKFEDVIISKEIARENIEDDTLLVIVDTHKESFVEMPELIAKSNKIAVIDHHRRSADYIEKAELIFQEAYASSTAELVTEILQYTETKVELDIVEAESLYAGIMVDTKNFTFKTGVRTFEAAAYLRKSGVDIIKVKKWFQSDFDSFNKIANIVMDADFINDSIAISIYEENTKDTNLLCAKAADELLTINKVSASFVLGRLDDKILISARSIGDINVQVILEKLGGGGHITLAGAQVADKTIEEAKEMLIEKINEYFSEIEI